MKLYFPTFIAVIFALTLNAQITSNSKSNWFISNSQMLNNQSLLAGTHLQKTLNFEQKEFTFKTPSDSLIVFVNNKLHSKQEVIKNENQVDKKPKKIVPRESTITTKQKYIPKYSERQGYSEALRYRVPVSPAGERIYQTNNKTGKREINWTAASGYLLHGLLKGNKN